MPDSTAEVFLHFVWATKGREPTIPEEAEDDVYRVIEGEAHRLRCSILAIGGTSNHIHLLVKFSRTTSFAMFMDQIKGVSSAFLNEMSKSNDKGNDVKTFRWQPGYGVFSVGRNQKSAIVAYICNQKAHHATNTIHDSWEPPDDMLSPLSPGRRSG